MTLQDIVDKHSEKIGTTYNGPSYHAIQHIIRSIDYVFPLYTTSQELTKNEIAEFREFFMFGWVSKRHFCKWVPYCLFSFVL